jgi:hypothetical protein
MNLNLKNFKTYPQRITSLKRINSTLRFRGDFPLSVKRVIVRVPTAIHIKIFVGLSSTANAAKKSDSLRLLEVLLTIFLS